MDVLFTQTKSAIDTCKAAVNRFVLSGLLDSDDALSPFSNTCMTRLRGMVAWLATEVEQVPSEETSLQELERIMSHRHARVPVVVCVGDSTKENVETSSADEVETSSPVDSRIRGKPGPHGPQNI